VKLETYILVRTRAFFTRRSDEPCPGAARFELVVSGVTPLRPAATLVAAFSPIRSGADPPASSTVEVRPWPPLVTRDT
jgi:hypothetical protein